MLKRITSVSAALVLLLGLFGVFAMAADGDYPSKWAEVDVQEAVFAGLIPDALQTKLLQAMTRAEFCALTVRLYETVTGEVITGRVKFGDTSDVNVEKMAYVKVANGTSPGKFTPDKALSREEAATMLARLSDALGKPFPK